MNVEVKGRRDMCSGKGRRRLEDGVFVSLSRSPSGKRLCSNDGENVKKTSPTAS